MHNPNSEYTIPFNYQDVNPQINQEPIVKESDNNEFNAIYKNLGAVCETAISNQPNNERELNQVSQRLYDIADKITESRQQFIDQQMANHSMRKKSFVKVIAQTIIGSDQSLRSIPTEQQLKVTESEIGAEIFGPLRPTERRAFFNDNHKSWFFHQEITDQSGVYRSVTLHYEVHSNGILRVSSQKDTGSGFINGQELDNFISSTNIYYDRVMNKIYNRGVSTDKTAA